MSYPGHDQRPAPYASENTFSKGVQGDTPAENTPATVLTDGLNMHLLRQVGSEVILQTEPGMQRSTLVAPQHLVHGFAERAGVLYLLLAEVDGEGRATGRGQLGSFPSPEYEYAEPASASSELVETGRMVDKYAPLRVYYGDWNPALPARPSDFISVEFAVALDSPSELELQDSYDGTLNIVINDRGRNPALLVNSGFAMVASTSPDDAEGLGSYRIVRREGAAQTNRYARADFTSRLRLHPKSGSMAKAYIANVADGGILPGGEYRYYFSYCDADNNETALFAEAGPVPVFDAPTPANAHGARPGEATVRRVSLRLRQLDATFGYVRVRYVRRSGEPSALGQGYLLTQRLAVPSTGVLEFAHTGYEDQQGLTSDQVAAVEGSASAFATMCQAGNRLLLGGIRQDAVEDADLVAFAQQLKLGHQEVALPGVPGLDTGSDASSPALSIYSPMDYNAVSGQSGANTPHTEARAVWTGGYLNPLNACYRRGYMRGESAPFAVRYVLDDYSVTDSYPLLGLDNVTNTATYPLGAPAFDATGWAGAVNKNGVYRFPLGNAPGLSPLLQANANAVNILAARVQLPPIPDTLRQRVVGIQFMRAERRPNALVQGYLLPALRALVTPPDTDVYDHADGTYTKMTTGSEGNLKLLPTVRGVLETCYAAYGYKSERGGVFPFVFNARFHDPKRLALYAPEAIMRPATLLAQLNEHDIQARVLGVAYTKRAVYFKNTVDKAQGGSWALYKTTHHTTVTDATKRTGRSFWTLDKQFVVNSGRFGSADKYLLGKHPNEDKYLVNLAWAPYVGVRFDQALLDAPALGTITGGNEPNTTGTGRELASDITTILGQAPVATGYLVNIYGADGLLSTEALRQVYQVQNLSYVPITQRLSWNELEAQLDAGRNLLLYGGDTYVGTTYRHVNRALPADERLQPTLDAPVGQVLSLVCETQSNPYARSDESVSTNVSSANSFLPRIGAGAGKFDTYRQAEYVSQGESTRYNGGYLSEGIAGGGALVQGAVRVSDVPYRARLFGSRVWASAPAVDGNFANGYRYLPALSFKDYEQALGAIVRLVPAGDQQLLVAHAHGLEVLALNERVLTSTDPARPVYAEGIDFLPPKGQIVSRLLGVQHPGAVCASGEGVYGIDASQDCIWFWPFGAREVMRLSDNAVRRWLAPVTRRYRAGVVALGQLDVRAVYDATRGDAVFSFYNRLDAEAFLVLVYSEPQKAWMPRASYRSQALLPVPKRGLFSLPLAGAAASPAGNYSLWRHRALPATGNDAQRGGAYGVPQECYAEFIVLGSGPKATKVLDNLLLLSDGRDADGLDVASAEQGAGFTQPLLGQGSGILKKTAERREGHTFVTVKGGEKRRGRWLRLRLTWSGTPQAFNANPKSGEQDAGRLLQVTSVVRDSFV